jgi:hypothetical protein
MAAPGFKILVVYPASRYVAERAFINSEIDAGNSANWINECLSATGSAPATHGWACFHADAAQMVKWCNRMSSLSVFALLVNFANRTKAEQIAWVDNMNPSLITEAGSYMKMVSNEDGEAITAAMKTAALTALGLQYIQAAMTES